MFHSIALYSIIKIWPKVLQLLTQYKMILTNNSGMQVSGRQAWPIIVLFS